MEEVRWNSASYKVITGQPPGMNVSARGIRPRRRLSLPWMFPVVRSPKLTNKTMGSSGQGIHGLALAWSRESCGRRNTQPRAA